MKFHLKSFNGCQLTERTQNSIANDKREITPKISKAELWFLCMTHRLVVLYNCIKFHFLKWLCHRLNCDFSLCGVMGSVLMCIFSVDYYIQ